MLPRPARLSRRADFTEVVRRGRRASRPLLTVHLLLPADVPADLVPADLVPADLVPADPGPAPGPPRAGLVVPRAVGGSVERHRTARRLRHLLRPRLLGPDPVLPPGARLVVRAAAPAGSATSAALAVDLDAALVAALARPRRATGGPRAGGRS